MIDPFEAPRGHAPLETRTFWRLLAAMPELGTAAWLYWVWLRPTVAGADAVRAATATVILEFPLLLALFGLMEIAAAEDDDWAMRWRGIALLAAGLLAVALFGAHSASFKPSLWLLGVVTAGVLGKWAAFREGRQQPLGIEVIKIALQFIVLCLLLNLSTDAPRLGFVPGTADALGLHDYVDGVGHRRDQYDGFPTWGLVAAAAVYMTLCGALRFLLAIRTPRVTTADRARRSVRATGAR